MRAKVFACCLVLGLYAGWGYAGSIAADVNGDGVVDMRDIAEVCDNWLWQAPDPCEFAFIPGGTFEMGDSFGEGLSGELPVHSVTLDSFYMGKYEITNQQYCDFLNSVSSQGLITVTYGSVYKAGYGISYPYCDTSMEYSRSRMAYNGSTFSIQTKGGRNMADDPMVAVSWYGAVAYCNWRSAQEGKEACYNLSTWDCDFAKKGYRLPTEAEWEHAARGGLSGRRFPWGDTISHSQANYYSSWSGGHPSYPYDVNPYPGYHPSWNDGIPLYTSPVGSFPANGFGLHDMAGNVSEWCNDWYDSYSPASQTNPAGPSSGSERVLRGGSWCYTAGYCRVATRDCVWPYYRDLEGIGFRVALGF